MLTWFYSDKEFKNILIVADRGFESYNMVSHFLNEGDRFFDPCKTRPFRNERN